MRASTVEKILFIIFDCAIQALCFVLFFPKYMAQAAVPVALWLMVFLCTALYRRWLLESRTTHVIHILKVVSVVYCLAIAAALGYSLTPILNDNQNLDTGKLFFNIKNISFYFASVWFFISVFRILICSILRRFLYKGWGADYILLLGCTNEAREYSLLFRDNPQLGKKVIGVVEENLGHIKSFDGLPILGTYSDLPNLVKKNNVQAIIIAHRSNSEKKINDILYWVAHLPVQVYLVPSLWECAKNFKTSCQPTLIHTKELQEIFVPNLLPWQATIKRIMDIVISIFLLLITSPLLLLTAIAIKLDSRGPVFYNQQRIGLYSRPLIVYKFRSMRTDAEKDGPQWAKKNDSRITRVGKIIRKFRIDEIPQLLCVLKGDMSLVGPRPERAVFIEKLRKTIPFYASRLKMKPGLTGWAQVRHHYDNDIEDVKIKLGYDIYYLSNASILLDIQILVRTVYVVLTGKGAQ
ncbi:MAG: sugar transferase [Fibromonadaceae bacterium]|jgi:exopolysaccharide biosynthesis polyprenyl glycosylphosphotransferase|nr:sugar transferase [Fibromonadaceae bacterium]